VTSSATGLRRGNLFQTIWSLAGPHRAALARSVGFKAAEATAQSIPVGLLAILIQDIRVGSLTTQALVWVSAVLAVCLVAQWLFGYLANRSAWLATFELFGAVRARGLDHLRRLPMGFHASRPTGETVTALTQDMNALELFVHNPMQQLIGAGTAPVVVFLVLLTQDVHMAIATIASVLISVPIFDWANRRFKVLAARRQDLQASLSSRMLEYIQGMQVIRAFGLTAERLDGFRGALHAFRAINLRLVAELVPPAVAFMLVVLLGIPAVIFFGALWLFGATIDAGTLIVFAVLALRVYQPLITAVQEVDSLRLADASLDRIAQVFDAPLQPESTQPAASLTRFDVTFDAVTFGYDAETPVLRDVSFDVAPGTMTAIVGPSGAGKTTILNLVARFWDPQAGGVRISGVDIRQLSSEQLFEAITVVFQDVYLFPGTIFDNIAFGNPDASPADVEAAARAARAHDFVRRLPLGYHTLIGEGGATLSGGERQRISIARAILKNAPIVMLDEHTSAIDSTNERHIQAALAELARGKTFIVVAHRLATIRAADQILVLDQGRVVQRGSHANLLIETGRYARLWAERERASTWRLGAVRDASGVAKERSPKLA
jgi:ATP-binding cassette, subfamily B, bacterial IrtB/YbtQ